MIKIVISKKDNLILSIQATGHSGYAVAGKDIVCAAVSILTQNLADGLKTIQNISPSVTLEEDTPYIKISLENNSKQEVMAAQVLMRYTQLGLKQVADQFKKYVDYKEK